MLTAIIVIVSLSFLILAHEAGHFFSARCFRLKVDEFGFGFPPRLFSWFPGKNRGRENGTRYSVNLLPFGGFVKIAGENSGPDEIKAAENLNENEKKRIFLFQAVYRHSPMSCLHQRFYIESLLFRRIKFRSPSYLLLKR